MSFPSWHPDPTGRHQHRYWDGSRWTEAVADYGVQSTDALAPAPTDPDDLPSTIVSTMTSNEILDEVTASLTKDGAVITTRCETALTGFVSVGKLRRRQDAFSIQVVDHGESREVSASGVGDGAWTARLALIMVDDSE